MSSSAGGHKTSTVNPRNASRLVNECDGKNGGTEKRRLALSGTISIDINEHIEKEPDIPATGN
jgi:hypothetical protein